MKHARMRRGTIDCPRLYFFHIPKTAGTSVRYWLADLFAVDEWLPCEWADQLGPLTREQINRYRFFSGHFADALPGLLDEPIQTVTWLREPLAREISNYRSIVDRQNELTEIAIQNNQPAWVEYLQFVGQNSLKEVCESHRFLGFRDNLQTRYLSGAFPAPSAVTVDRAMLDRAKFQLRQMFHVGIQEWMSASIDLLAYRLGCPRRPIHIHPTALEHDGALAIDADTLNVIRQVNQFDLEVYQFGRELFLAAISDFWRNAMGPAREPMSAEMLLEGYSLPSVDAAIQSAIDGHFQSLRKGDEQTDQWNVDFSKAVYLKGWYPRETGRIGPSIRWAGPDQTSSLFLPLDTNRSYRLSCDADNVAGQDVLQSLKLRVGEQTLPIQWRQMVRRSGERFLRITSFVPRDSLSPNLTYNEIGLETSGHVPINVPREGWRNVSLATNGLHLRAA